MIEFCVCMEYTDEIKDELLLTAKEKQGMKLDFDYHNHTHLSRCSRKDYTVEEMLQMMREKGLRHVGFSDHFYADETVPAENVALVRAAAANFPEMDVYAGVEADMLWPGHLTATAETLSPYDYVSVACPHWHSNEVARPLCLTPDSLAQAQYDMLLSLAEIAYVDVIVHPFTFGQAQGYMEVDQEALMQRYTLGDYDRLIDGLLKNQIAVELHANLKKPHYARSLLPFLTRCVSRGVHFSMGSDAHELKWVGSILGAREYIDGLQILDELAFRPKKKSE